MQTIKGLSDALRSGRVAHLDGVAGEEGGAMSRTQKGSKGPGYEYWSARPGNRHGATPGKTSKKLTHRAERRAGKVAKTGWQDN